MPATPSFLKADISAESLKKLLTSRPTLQSLTGGASGSSKRGGRSRATVLVGLDIQPGYVSAVQVRVNGKIEVQRAVGAPLPPDTVREGEVIDGQALSETLRELFAGARLDKRVRIGVANQRTVLRTLEMPPIPEGKELETAVRFQAEDQIPMPLESAVLDYQTLGVIDTPAGPRQRVVVVAAQKDMVERLIAAVRAAGLRPEAVDLSAFALIRSLHRAGEHEGRVLYLNVGGLTNMAIADGADCRFTRVAAGGLESMATAVAERNGIPLAKARELLAAVDLSASAPAASLAAEALTAVVQPPVDGAAHETPTAEQAATIAPAAAQPLSGQDSPAPATEAQPLQAAEPAAPREPEIDVRPVLVAGVREIASEVRNSLDFHRSQGGGDEVSTVVLSGAALQIAGFADALQAELSVPVVTRTVALADAGAAGSISPEQLAVAAGLAVAEAPR
ncbi:MAG TPA: type IV pilus assembly protein PilM [Solirubrobacteraceae bacterium]|jgi:type IV pilus assembly protein PilM|nr:type IV pilus assembly protein PilM [Solirubrobacteraceae bacterium]